MPPPRLSHCQRVLVVEGHDDLLFYAECLEWLNNLSGVFIQQMGGKGNMTGKAREGDLAIKLETFINPALLAEKVAIGVIADADTDAAGACRSLEAQLSKITGQKVTHGGWTAGPPRIGLYVVPGGGMAGEIESLVWQAWSNDPAHGMAKACIDSFIDCMQASGHKVKSLDKGRIGALLSVLNDEDPRLGPGARSRVFDFARPELALLLDFLRAL